MIKRRISKRYIPWLLLLLSVDSFSVLLIWLSDHQAFYTLAAVAVLASLLFFAAVLRVLGTLEQNRRRAFCAFLENPDEYHEKQLLKAVGEAQAEELQLLFSALHERQNACDGLKLQLSDYEEYVESWAHGIKVPLSLLTLLLDNRREEFSGTVGFKLDYVRQSMQESVDQMLFYARVKGARKDYLFEHIPLGTCVEEVLEDYHILLEEKNFQVCTENMDSLVYTDRRGLHFVLEQAVSNAVKYSGDYPRLSFSFALEEQAGVLRIRDNGTGVKSCDLPYVFEKGFTGESGENRKRATGMGLYLAREIAGELGISLEAESEWGKGFELRVIFPVVRQ